MQTFMYVRIYAGIYACMYVCMYMCIMYVRMHVCMYNSQASNFAASTRFSKVLRINDKHKNPLPIFSKKIFEQTKSYVGDMLLA
jgi:hypothetical protein